MAVAAAEEGAGKTVRKADREKTRAERIGAMVGKRKSDKQRVTKARVGGVTEERRVIHP